MNFEVTILFFIFIFGTIIGSFLNVVIYRFNTGKGLSGRSSCFSCRKTLTWYELIPVLSFVIQKGRCLSCKSKISWQYPLVEFATGAMFLLVAWKFFFLSAIPLSLFSLLLFAFYLIVWSALVVIFVYDLKHTIIPDFFAYLFIIFSALLFVLQYGGKLGGGPIQFSFFDVFAPIILFIFFGGLWLVSGGRWMGFGDAKLSIGIGFLLGWKGSVIAFLLSFWVGALVGIYLLSLQARSFTMKSEIPFGPFLIAGTFVAFLISPNFFIF